MVRPLRILAASLLVLSGCAALQMESPHLAREQRRQPERDRLALQRVSRDSVVLPLEEGWSYNAGAAFGVGPPLIVGETVLVGTLKGEVHGIDLATGRRTGIKNFGEVVDGRPLLHGSLLIVPVARGRRSLIAYDLLRGQVAWSLRGTPIAAGLLRWGETVITVDTDAVVGSVDAERGEVLWERSLRRNHAIHAAPVSAGGHVVVVDDQGVVTALDPESGALVWESDLGSPVYADLAADDEHLYVPTTRGRLFAVAAADGVVRWEAALDDSTVRIGTPAVEGDLLVVGATDGRLRAFSASRGDVYWTFRCAEAVSAPPLLTPNSVLVGSLGQMLYVVDRFGGELVWQQRLRGRVKSALAVKDVYVVVLSEPRHVTLFKTAGEDDDTES